MQATTQTRLRLSDEAEDVLQRYGQLYGALKRKLYARVAAGGRRRQGDGVQDRVLPH